MFVTEVALTAKIPDISLKWADHHASRLTSTRPGSIMKLLDVDTLFDPEELNGYNEKLISARQSFQTLQTLLESHSISKTRIVQTLKSHVDELIPLLERIGSTSWKKCEVEIYYCITEVALCRRLYALGPKNASACSTTEWQL